MSRSKKRRARYQKRQPEAVRAASPRPRPPAPSARADAERRRWLVAGGALVLTFAALLFIVFVLPNLNAAPAPTATPAASGPIASLGPVASLGPPAATPLASPPADPAGDGTRATIETSLGNIVIELFNESAPVASENFINLAEAGFYDGVVFHRLAPGFVIQGGDPQGDGSGGPGYTIQDEPVVGDYVRGVVAMARPANTDGSLIPDSQGSQFFICLDDLRSRLPKSGGYAIFGRVIEGMEVVDQIAAMPNSGERALDPVAMTRVTIQGP
jgi:peptidyl-prolyl cis-trans isomerase B (cyclophilin B)